MRGKIKQHLLDSVSMESKKMHKKKKKAKMQDQLDEHKARLASTQQHTTQKTVHIKVKMTSR